MPLLLLLRGSGTKVVAMSTTCHRSATAGLWDSMYT